MGKKKGGTPQYLYFGTAAGYVCMGPVDELVALIVDNKLAWPVAPDWKVGNAYVVSPTPSIVRRSGRVWVALQAHTATADNAPAAATDSDQEVPPDAATHWTEYSIRRSDHPTHYDGTAEKYGPFRIYWGTETQTASAFLNDNELGLVHPAYLGVCYIVFGQGQKTSSTSGWLQGQERQQMGNVSVLVRKKPETTLVTSVTEYEDGAVNPASLIEERLTGQLSGLGLAIGDLDEDSFQQMAERADADRGRYYIAPLFGKEQPFNAFLDDLELELGWFLRANPVNNQIQLCSWSLNGGMPWLSGTEYVEGEIVEQGGSFYSADSAHTANGGNAPDQADAPWTVVPKLTYKEIIGRVKLTPEGPAKAITTIRYSFADRNRIFHRNGDQISNPRALSYTGGVQQPKTHELSLITRSTQARQWAAEAARQLDTLPMKASLRARWPVVDARGIRQGGNFLLDVQITPGGTERLRMFRCLRMDRRGDEVEITAELDQSFGPAIYATPRGPASLPSDEDVPEVVRARPFILPPALEENGDAYGVGLLVSRPDPLVTEFDVAYDNDASGDFPTVLQSVRGFAAFGYLVEDAAHWGAGTAFGTADDWVIGEAVVVDEKRTYSGRVWKVTTNHTTSSSERPDTSGKWAEVGLRFALFDENEFYRFAAGITAAGQRDDELMLVVLHKTGGQIDQGAEGSPYLEIFSVGNVTATGSTDTGPTGDPDAKANAIYTLNVMRSRFGTLAREFDDEAEAWLVAKSELPQLAHLDFPKLAATEASAFFYFIPGTANTKREDFDTQFEMEFVGAEAFSPAVSWTDPANKAVIGTTSGTAQVETATVAGDAVAGGDVIVTVTGAGISGSPLATNVTTSPLDTAATIGGLIRTALSGVGAITALYAVGGAGANITLTRLIGAADDATLNIAIDGTTNGTGVPDAPTSADTTAGVAAAPLEGVSFEGFVTDQNANLTGLVITKRLSDSTSETTVLAESFAATARRDFNFETSFEADGTYYITATATDSAGNVRQSVLVVIVEPLGGVASITATPDLSPAGGSFFSDIFPVTVNATCDTGGASIEMQVTGTDQVTLPVAGWSAVTSVEVSANQRVWARATAGGLDDSEAAVWTFTQR